MCLQTVDYSHIQQSINIQLEFCFCPPAEYKSNIHSLLALFLVSWGKYLSL